MPTVKFAPLLKKQRAVNFAAHLYNYEVYGEIPVIFDNKIVIYPPRRIIGQTIPAPKLTLAVLSRNP